MSRSYKKIPCVKGGIPEAKYDANRVVRRFLKNVNNEIADGKSFRKLYPQYDIVESKIAESFKSYVERIEKNNHDIIFEIGWKYDCLKLEDVTSKDVYRDWYTMYKMK